MLLFLLFAIFFGGSGAVRITDFAPHYILSDGVMLFIFGEDFSKTTFNFDNPNLGNKVFLRNNLKSYPCEIHPDKCNSHQLTCYTPKMPPGPYTIHVIVDSVSEHMKRGLYHRYEKASTLTSVSESVTVPGRLLSFKGSFKTNIFGSDSGQQNDPRILRAFIGGAKCNMINESAIFDQKGSPGDKEQLYGLTTNEIKCKNEGGYVGYQNASVLISGDVGRTKPTFWHISPDEQLYMHQTYAIIENVYPSNIVFQKGSVLRIDGKFFDATESPIEVNVGSRRCRLLENTDQFISCKLDEINEEGKQCLGNRGAYIYEWNQDISIENETVSTASKRTWVDGFPVTGWKYDPSMKGFMRFVIKIPFTSDYGPKVEVYMRNLKENGFIRWKNATELKENEEYEIRIRLNLISSFQLRQYLTRYVTQSYSPIVKQLSMHIELKLNEPGQNVKITHTFSLNTIPSSPIIALEMGNVNNYNVIEFIGKLVRWKFGNVYSSSFLITNSSACAIEAREKLMVIPLIEAYGDLLQSINGSEQLLVVEYNDNKLNLRMNPILKNDEEFEIIIDDPTADIITKESIEGSDSNIPIGWWKVGSVRSMPFIDISYEKSKIVKELDNMFQNRCPKYVKNSNSLLPDGSKQEVLVHFSGSDDVESFCGRYSYKLDNWRKLTVGENIKNRVRNFNTICFAFKGTLRKIQYSFYWSRHLQGVDVMNEEKTFSEWSYECVTVDITHFVTRQIKEVDYIEFYGNGFVDEVTIRKKKIYVDYKQIMLSDSKTIQKRTEDDDDQLSLKFLIKSMQCQQFGKEDLEIVSTKDTSNSVAEKIGDDAFSLNGNLLVKSPELLESIPIDISNISLGPTSIYRKLKEYTNVVSTTTINNCDHKKFVLKFPQTTKNFKITVSKEQIEFNDRSTLTTKKTDHFLAYHNLPGDFIRPLMEECENSSKIPVTVKINGINSNCSGNCLVAAVRANISIIKISNDGTNRLSIELKEEIGSQPLDSFQITFVNAKDEKIYCEVAEIEKGTIICLLEEKYLDGPLSIEMVSDNFGKIGSTADSIDEIIPQIDKVEFNGNMINVTARYFPSCNNSLVINDQQCSLIYFNDQFLLFDCQLNSKVIKSIKFNEKTISVGKTKKNTKLNIVGLTGEILDYEMKYGERKRIVSRKFTEVMILKGKKLENVTNVYFGTEKHLSKIIVADDEEIFIQTPETIDEDGIYKIGLCEGSVCQLQEVEVNFAFGIYDISPKCGSWYGGTNVTVYGFGLPFDCSNSFISMNEDRRCRLLECKNDKMICQTASGVTEIIIDNSGYSQEFGDNFNWHPRIILAKKGQKVTWMWKYSSGYTKTIAIKIMEVTINGEKKSNGFSSGEFSRVDGTYSRIFSTAGTYYFSGGRMMKNSTYAMLGKVIVTDDIEVTDNPQMNTVKVYIDNQLVPIHDTPASLKLSDDCPNKKFNFKFMKNLSPIIKSIDSNEIYSNQTISVIRGENLVSATSTHQIFAVKFNKRDDILNDPSSVYPRRIKVIDKQKVAQCISIDELTKKDEIHCQWKLLTPINYGQSYWLDVNIGDGYGQSLIHSNADAEIILKFKYDFNGVSPINGSTQGNYLITLNIEGVSNNQNVQVKIGEKECKMKEEIGSITCMIPPGNPGPAKVLVSINGAHNISCDSCNFLYDPQLISQLTEFGEESKFLDEENSLKILGKNLIFDNNLETDVNFVVLENIKTGKPYECKIESLATDYLTCIFPSSILPGEYKISSVVSPQIGNISNNVSSNLQIQSNIQIDPLSIKINGNGGNVVEFKTMEQFDDINNEIYFHSTHNNDIQVKCHFKTNWRIDQITTDTEKYCVLDYLADVSLTEYIPFVHRYGIAQIELKDYKLIIQPYDRAIPTIQFDDLTWNGQNQYIATLINVPPIDLASSQLLFTDNDVDYQNIFTELLDLTDNKLKFRLMDGIIGHKYNGYFRINNTKFLQSKSNELSLKKGFAETKSGSYYAGGGQRLEINQIGFGSFSTIIKIGDVHCNDVKIEESILSCLIPPVLEYSEKKVPISLELGDEQLTISRQIKMTIDDMMMINYIPKLYGGSGGGSVLDILGNNFDGKCQFYSVTMNDISLKCEKTIENRKIRCETSLKLKNNRSLVKILFDCDGSIIPTIFKRNTLSTFKNEDHKRSIQSYNQEINEESNGIWFTYIDRWSSIATWNNENVPEEGDFIIINKEDTIVLDTTTPVLKFLLIKGGKLVFDPVKSAHLKTENILITENGTLEIGTEEKPYVASGKITMFGHLRSTEMPLFGSKTLALRKGTIDIHGKEIGRPFTLLDRTASRGTKQIRLKHSVPWEVGNEIVLATTGNRLSMKENELATIKSIDRTGKIIGLEKPLKYEHLGIRTKLDTKQFELRGEVALLSRNIKFSGFSHPSWHVKIPACAAGFNPGEFSVQTCFQGRFGEEIGNDQFGGAIMVSQEVQNSQSVQMRISNLEMEHVGQAFRLGRYPIHFHRNGNMNGSYVRATTIRNGFNRAINVHDTHEVMVEHNVAYNIMGGAFFFEDGSEQNNIMQYNLVLFVKASSSLLNDDITPAAYWITHPTNFIRHNRAAGGTHFGFWYRLHAHPDGPSATKEINCRTARLGEFHNNTVHSVGWFGLWIHETYIPKQPAHFTNFFTWNTEKGIEVVIGGKIKFSNYISINNRLSGFDGKFARNIDQFSPTTGYNIEDSFISAKLRASDQCKTRAGILLPWGSGVRLKNILFYGFDSPECTGISGPILNGICKEKCGGYISSSEQLKFKNSPNRITLSWLSQLIIIDIDGSLTGKQPISSINSDYGLEGVTNMTNKGMNYGAFIHPPKYKNWVHFGIIAPYVKTQCLMVNIPKLTKKNIFIKPGINLIISDGYMGSFQSNQTNTIRFVSDEVKALIISLAQITFTLVIEDLPRSSWIIVGVGLKMLPDKFSISNLNGNMSEKSLTYEDNSAGDWYYDANKEMLEFLLTKNGNYEVSAIQCEFPNCISPESVEIGKIEIVPPISPIDFEEKLFKGKVLMWSNVTTWEKLMNISNVPKFGDNVTIPKGEWVLMDVKEVPQLDSVNIYGNLVFDRLIEKCLFQANHINVYGRLVVGWADKPMLNRCTIRLYGKRTDPFYEPEGYTTDVGSKFIAVYGTMDLHGRKRFPSWTKSESKIKGNVIKLVEPVEWEIGDEISIGGFSDISNYKIKSISNNRRELTLNTTVSSYANYEYNYRRLPNNETTHLTPIVALLSRYLVVEGNDNFPEDYWGVRIIVTQIFDYEDYTRKVGTARISHTAVRNFGHESLYDDSSPHYGLAFFKTIDSFGATQSYIVENSFINGNSPAIGSFDGTNNLVVRNNVIYRAVRFGMRHLTNSPIIRSNIILNTIDGSQLNEYLSYAPLEYTSAISVEFANSPQLLNNIVINAFSASYNFKEYPCERSGIGSQIDVPDYNMFGWKSGKVIKIDETEPYNQPLFINNHAYGASVGTLIVPSQGSVKSDCLLIEDFVFVRLGKVAIYAQTGKPIHIRNVLLIENAIGIFLYPFGTTSNKHVLITDSVIVGRDESLSKCSSLRRNSIGVIVPEITRRKNREPKQDILSRNTYPYFDKGYMLIENVKFVGFINHCKADYDVAISTAGQNDDSAMPIYLSRMIWERVHRQLYNGRPNIRKINPSDCVDMECDGLKKVLIVDLDGTSFGSVGATAFSISEMAYNKNPRRGLGDYRLPAGMVTDRDGAKIPIDEIVHHHGIVRNDNCELLEKSNMYLCHNYTYGQLVMTNNDFDRETRRLSPVAILSDDGYVDLINGPQDFGWCLGYTCKKRLSHFMAIIVLEKSYKLFLTTTSFPANFEISLKGEFAEIFPNRNFILLKIFNHIPMYMHVYYKGKYIEQFYKSENSSEVEKMMWQRRLSGDNFYDRDNQLLYLSIHSNDTFNIIRRAELVLKFETEFFQPDKIIDNIAQLFNIDKSRIKAVKIVKELNDLDLGRRRRRAVEKDTVQITIETTPEDDLSQIDLTKDEDVLRVQEGLLELFYNGTLSDILETGSINNLDMVEAVPPVNNSAYKIFVTNTIDPTVNSEQRMMIPGKLNIMTTVNGCVEQVSCTQQAVIQIFSSTDDKLYVFGSASNPWTVFANLIDENNNVIGTFEALYKCGNATFTNIHGPMSGQYKLRFYLDKRSKSDKMILSDEFDVADLETMSGETKNFPEYGVIMNEKTTISFQLIDKLSKLPIHDISWKNHSWNVQLSIHNESLKLIEEQYETTLNRSLLIHLTDSFNNEQPMSATNILANNEIIFQDISFSLPALYVFEIFVESEPNDYSFQFLSKPFLVNDTLFNKYGEKLTENNETDVFEIVEQSVTYEYTFKNKQRSIITNSINEFNPDQYKANIHDILTLNQLNIEAENGVQLENYTKKLISRAKSYRYLSNVDTNSNSFELMYFVAGSRSAVEEDLDTTRRVMCEINDHDDQLELKNIIVNGETRKCDPLLDLLKGNKKTNTLLIVLCVFGGLIIVAGIVLFALWYTKKTIKKPIEPQIETEESSGIIKTDTTTDNQFSIENFQIPNDPPEYIEHQNNTTKIRRKPYW
ncbi:hypothetical protein SNEBB_006210 [Seison nebaliae]|nr:hypothetical protein SNEBB_006210 [Seison nebaliae]